ncbi:MAG: SPOR domain-containing protein, partial [Flavobacteriales bacterium]|nr:SPOR domain-containing protein [Flavobacteriales bacterium]
QPSTAVVKGGIKFKVQLGAYGAAIPMDHFNKFVKLGKISTEKGEDGLTRYYVGEFATYDEAKAFNTEMTAKGINGSFVVGENQGKTIKAQDAIDLLKR